MGSPEQRRDLWRQQSLIQRLRQLVCQCPSATLAGAADGLGRNKGASMDFVEAMDVAINGAALELENERLYRRAPFPLYGLSPHWQGERLLGDSEESSITSLDSGLVESRGLQLGLMHGNPLDVADLHVVSSVGVQRPPLAWLLSTQVGRRPGSTLAEEESPFDSQARADTVSLGVNYEFVVFEILQGRGGWVARADRVDHLLTLESDGFPIEDVALHIITDLEPYIRGRRQLLERLRGAE